MTTLFRGDEVMADRGFTLEPELEVQGTKLNVPAFTKGTRFDIDMSRVFLRFLFFSQVKHNSVSGT